MLDSALGACGLEEVVCPPCQSSSGWGYVGIK